MTPEARVRALERLRDYFRMRPGGAKCRMLSKGEECECPLCDLDRLADAPAPLADATAREPSDLVSLVEDALILARVATNTWACVARSKRDHDVIAGLHRDIDALRARLTPAAPPAPDTETE